MPEIQKNREDVEPRGITGQRVLEKFEKRVFSSLVMGIQETNQYDANDLNGIDYIWDIQTEQGIRQLAVDVTDPDAATRMAKITRLRHMPCVCLHDENKRPISELMPRVLINYRLGYFLMMDEQARLNGKQDVYEQMTESEREAQKKDQLKQILDQMALLATPGSTYAKLSAPIREAFEKEMLGKKKRKNKKAQIT